MRRLTASLLLRLLAVVAVAGGLVGVAAVAHATEPIPPFVEYAGSGGTESNFGASGPYPAAMRVDCSTGTCLLSATLSSPDYVWDLTQGRELELVDGHGEFAMSEWGDICGGFWSGAGPMTVDADADGISIVRTGDGAPDISCLGGAEGFPIHFTATITGAMTGGDACVLDGSCPSGTPLSFEPVASGVDEPGTLSTLPTVTESSRPSNILWAIGFAVVLVLLVAFPTHLLNTAAENGTDRFSAWWARMRRPRELPAALRKLSGWPLAIAGVVVASVVSAFVDPRFGQDPGASLRILGSILLAFLVDVGIGWVLLLLFLQRTMPDAKARLRFAPASLLLVVAAVIFSRITGFQPGIVFGLVAGVVIGASLANAEKARVALLGLGYSFAAGVLGWIGFAIVSAVAGDDPSFGVVFLQETLSAIAIGGMAVLPVALFPLRGMTGYDIFAWNKVVWAIAYGVGLFGFFFVLMPMPFAWQGVPLELGVWIGLYLFYALTAIGIWTAISRPWQRGKATA